METGQLRYLTASLAAALAALAGYANIISIEYWATVAGLIAVTAADIIKHRNE